MSSYTDPGDQNVEPPPKDSTDPAQESLFGGSNNDKVWVPPMVDPYSLPYQRHSETSKEAAEAAKPTASTYRKMVLDYLRGAGFVEESDDACPECWGDGGWHDCGEDSCPCLYPDEITDMCQYCGGSGDAPCIGGATDPEMQEDLQLEGSTQRPRRVELVNAGLVRDSGRKRKTKSGRWAVVWEAV